MPEALAGIARPSLEGLISPPYRIVQEGLRNALKHAHASDADVTVRYRPNELEIEVRGHRASFLLPHRRSAWLRFAERLDVLAHFAAGFHPPGGEDVTATVSGALSRTASNLMSHVEAV